MRATTGKEPDHIQDDDLLSVEELRGTMKEISKAEMTLREKATIRGISAEITALKQQMERMSEKMQRLTGIYGTLRSEFDDFKQQRIKELSIKINGGSTTPEDL